MDDLILQCPLLEAQQEEQLQLPHNLPNRRRNNIIISVKEILVERHHQTDYQGDDHV